MSHRVIEPKVFYVGTPVVLISTRNEDGTANLAPMSSAWWLGSACMLGLSGHSHTASNLRREREAVLNLAHADLVDAVDRIALLTGSRDIPPAKRARGYTFEPDKFGAAGLSPLPAELVGAPRVAECQIQLEVEITDMRPFAASHLLAIEARVVRSHVDERIIVEGSDHHIAPERWDPLIMKFCEFYGHGQNLAPSRLAAGWQMPPLRPAAASARRASGRAAC